MKKNNGFTLAEVLVAIVIGVISVAAAFSAYNYYTKSYDAVTQKSAVNSSAREALTLITKDLRNAGYIDPNFLSASCENITTERQARLKLLSVSSRRTGLSGKYGQSDFLAMWYSISPKERKRVFYWIVKEQNSNDYFLARDVVINPEGRSRGNCPTNNSYTHPVDTELLVANVEDFQVIFKDKDGNVLVPVCVTSCGTVEQSQGNGNTVATKYGNMTQGQANQELVHTADVYITVRSPNEIFKTNRTFQLVNGEQGHGGSISVPGDKYYRETFFASVHTRNLATPQVPVLESGTTTSEGQGYNK